MKILFPGSLTKKFFLCNNYLTSKSKKSFSEEVLNSLNKNTTSSNLHNMIFNYGISCLPHRDKRHKGGEDSYCSDDNLIAVADGVGGWNEVGVDPALYSKDLCNDILKEFKKSENTTKTANTIDIFDKACKQFKHRGSSTCCICRIDNEKSNVIETLNLGDSGYLLLRPYSEENNNNLKFKIMFKSEEQTHGFNFPFQVGEGGDNPRSADINSHEVKPYDIIVLATDGLWDNLSNENIIKIIHSYFSKIAEVQKELINKENKDSEENNLSEVLSSKNKFIIPNVNALSEYITKTAEHMSLDKNYKSPFSERSKGLYIGGKHDDITIIVAQMMEKTPKF
jgi:protein phosphatase PTC7